MAANADGGVVDEDEKNIRGGRAAAGEESVPLRRERVTGHQSCHTTLCQHYTASGTLVHATLCSTTLVLAH